MEELLTTMNVDQLSGLMVGGILGVVLGGMAAIGMIVWIAMLVLNTVGCWKIYNKFGEPGWKCLIPFYNTWVEYQYTWDTKMAILVWVLSFGSGVVMEFVGNQSFLYDVFGILSLVGWVISIIGYHKLAKAFGKGVGYTIGMILMPSIFVTILGLGKSQYIGNTSK